MPYVDEDDDDEDAEHEAFDEREYPDDTEADWNLDPSVIACPYCREEISEDASRCPHCGQYVSQEDAPTSPVRIWTIAIIVILLLTMIFWWRM